MTSTPKSNIRGTHYDKARESLTDVEGELHNCSGGFGDPRPVVVSLMQVEATAALVHAMLAVADAIRAKL